jgi:hypothetical protein
MIPSAPDLFEGDQLTLGDITPRGDVQIDGQLLSAMNSRISLIQRGDDERIRAAGCGQRGGCVPVDQVWQLAGVPGQPIASNMNVRNDPA